jgi:hypothetical protein
VNKAISQEPVAKKRTGAAEHRTQPRLGLKLTEVVDSLGA